MTVTVRTLPPVIEVAQHAPGGMTLAALRSFVKELKGWPDDTPIEGEQFKLHCQPVKLIATRPVVP